MDLADADTFLPLATRPLTPICLKRRMLRLQRLKGMQSESLFQQLRQAMSIMSGHTGRAQTYLLANKVLDDLFTYLTDTSADTPVLSSRLTPSLASTPTP